MMPLFEWLTTQAASFHAAKENAPQSADPGQSLRHTYVL